VPSVQTVSSNVPNGTRARTKSSIAGADVQGPIILTMVIVRMMDREHGASGPWNVRCGDGHHLGAKRNDFQGIQPKRIAAFGLNQRGRD
jgi:hypothetical protein